MNEQRAAFEAWAKSRNAPTDITANVYHNASVEFAWLAWQAAMEHAKKQPTQEPHCECHERDGLYVCEYC